MTERFASTGKTWFCMMCGKRTQDRYGKEGGWDESCALNSVEMDADLPLPEPAACKAFADERDNYLAGMGDRINKIYDDWINLKTDPELLKLAEAAVQRLNSRPQSA